VLQGGSDSTNDGTNVSANGTNVGTNVSTNVSANVSADVSTNVGELRKLHLQHDGLGQEVRCGLSAQSRRFKMLRGGLCSAHRHHWLQHFGL
jgi:hypothetical protein